MDGMTMRVPRILPSVPTDDDVRRLLEACPNSFEGRRNRAIIALAADSGLRREELRRLRIGDLDLAARLIHIRDGKGRKDGVTFFADATASILRTWLATHPAPHPASHLFCKRDGESLGPHRILQNLHRLSKRAGLARKIGPHALRHYAATAVLRNSGDLDLVRRVLRHENLTMAMRYVALAQSDVAAKFQHASPLDHLRRPILGRGGIRA
jgi:site-specific recombinase XerC